MKRAVLSFIIILILSMGLMACGKNLRMAQTAAAAVEVTASAAEAACANNVDIAIPDGEPENGLSRL